MAVVGPKDVDKITITEVKYKDHPDCTRDIVVEFPDYMGKKRISFIEAGLINAIPGAQPADADDTVAVKKTDDSNHVIPKVAIQFYGELKTIYE